MRQYSWHVTAIAVVLAVSVICPFVYIGDASAATCRETSSGYKFCIEDYQIAASGYEPGNTVFVDVTIENQGTQIGTVEATLGIQNPSDSRTYPDVETVEIPQGEQRTLSLQYTLPSDADSGTYDVTVDLHPPGGTFLFDTTGYTKTFDVNRPPSSSVDTPTDTSPTIEAGESLTFTVEANDPDGDLAGVDWYVDGSRVETNSIGGSSDEDSFSRTFSSPGTYTVEADVFDDSRAYNDQAAKWIVDVDPPEGDLDVTARDETGDTIDDAELILYDDDYDEISSKVTDSSGDASWSNLEVGQYNLELYGPDGYFWRAKPVEVDSDGMSVTIRRKAPRLTGVSLTGENGDSTYVVGETITIGPEVRNDGPRRDVRVQIKIDTDDDNSADKTIIRGDRSTDIATGDTGYYGYDYQPSSAGTKQVRVVTEAYINDGWNATDDSGWVKTFDVRSNQGDLTISAVDANGNAVDGGTIVLYDDSSSSWTKIEEKETDSSGQGSWLNLDTGLYNIELYGPNGDYWGTKADVEVDIDGAGVTIQRKAPRVTTVDLTDKGDGTGAFLVDETITISPEVRNDAAERPVRVKIHVDTDNDGSAEQTITRPIEGGIEIPTGETEWYGYDFVPSSTGTKQVRVVTETYLNEGWKQTDRTNWHPFTIENEDIVAQLTSFDVNEGTYTPDDTVESVVTVKNSGNTRHEFYIGYSFIGPDGDEYNNSGTTDVAVTLDPEERKSVTVSWEVPSEAPIGEYDAVTAVWKNRESGSLTGRFDQLNVENAVRIDRSGEVVIVNYDPQTETYDNRTVARSSITFESASASLPVGFDANEYSSPGIDYRSKRITSTDQYPWSAVGAIGYSSGSDSDSFCSATVIEDNHVVTAAHCVYNHETDAWSANKLLTLEFSAGQDHDELPFGSAKVVNIQTYRSYVDDNRRSYDLAVLTLNESVSPVTGSFGYEGHEQDSDVYTEYAHLTGYPTSAASYVDQESEQWDLLANGEGTGVLVDSDCRNTRLCHDVSSGSEFEELAQPGMSGGPVWQDPNEDPTIISVLSGGPDADWIRPISDVIAVRFSDERYTEIGSMVQQGNEINLSPTARLSSNSDTIKTGEEVQFNAGKSADPDSGQILSYKWDFNSDGQVDKTTQTPTTTYVYENPGRYDANVVVVDSGGSSDTDRVMISVQSDGPEFRNKAVYVWGYAGPLATNDAAADRFFERANEKDINTVFLSWGAFSSVSASERAAFIAQAHENDLQVHALIGTSGSSAVTNAEQTVPDVIAYNEERASEAQLDGVHLDVEPGTADLGTFLDDYQSMLDGARTQIQSDSGATINSQGMALSSAVGWWWPNNAPTKTQQLVEQSALDYVVVMAYWDTEQEVRSRLSNIVSDADTQYVVAVETQEFTQGGDEHVTFYEEGEDAADSTLQNIADSPPSSGHLGGAYHYYQSSVSTWDALKDADTTKSSLGSGETVTVNADVLFDDNFPRSSHRSQVVVEFEGQGSTYTAAKTITPPSMSRTTSSVEWTVPSEVEPGEYQVTASLLDTTLENDQREATASRSTPIKLNEVDAGTVTIETKPPVISDFSVTNPSGETVQIQFDSSEPLSDITVELTKEGDPFATLTKADFSVSQGTYTASYEGSAGSTYSAVLKTATDSAGNDGAEDQADTVSIEPEPKPPEAIISAPEQIKAGSTITLDASESTDPDGDDNSLTYSWSVRDQPTDASVTPPSGPTDDVTLSTVGTYEFEVTVTDAQDETASATATVTVQPPSLGAFENSPTDPDGDGKYEDVNGDGSVNVGDAQALFANTDDPVVQNNPDAFDFNDDGSVNVGDAQALFANGVDA